MEVSVSHQIYISFCSIILGFTSGLIYDFIRIIRVFLGIRYVNRFTEKLSAKKFKFIKNPFYKKETKTKREAIKVFITDIIYFVIMTPIFMIFLYHQNNGSVRWFVFFSVVLGFLSYYFTVGKIIISVSEYIVFYIKAFFLHVIFFISKPLIPILKFIKNKSVYIRGKIKIHIQKNKDKKKAKSKKSKMLIHFGKI